MIGECLSVLHCVRLRLTRTTSWFKIFLRIRLIVAFNILVSRGRHCSRPKNGDVSWKESLKRTVELTVVGGAIFPRFGVFFVTK